MKTVVACSTWATDAKLRTHLDLLVLELLVATLPVISNSDYATCCV